MRRAAFALLLACNAHPALDVPSPPPDAAPVETCAECRERCAELDASTAIPIILCSFHCDVVCNGIP